MSVFSAENFSIGKFFGRIFFGQKFFRSLRTAKKPHRGGSGGHSPPGIFDRYTGKNGKKNGKKRKKLQNKLKKNEKIYGKKTWSGVLGAAITPEHWRKMLSTRNVVYQNAFSAENVPTIFFRPKKFHLKIKIKNFCGRRRWSPSRRAACGGGRKIFEKN